MKGFFFLPQRLILLAAFCVVGSLVHAQMAPELREDGVLYLEGNVPGKVTGSFKVSTALYSRRDFKMAVAAIQPGQVVEFIGAAPDGYLVKGTYRNNSVTGWIRPEDLPTGFDTGVFVEAQKSQEWHDKVTAAIANKSVIQGMSPDEVEKSVGKPETVSSKTDAQRSLLTWVYTTYKEEPQYSYGLNPFGQTVLQTYYVKIPIGQMIVSFEHDAVTSVEQTKTDPNHPGVVNN